MTLTTDQITAIDRHLRKDNWLLNEALIAELTDHYVYAIIDQMQNGVSFDLALLDVHKAFGGRKGLLKMEEEYGKTQARSISRKGWQRFLSYFKRPRIGWTIATVVIVYSLITWYKTAGYSLVAFDSWTFLIIMGGFAVVYFTLLYKLLNTDWLSALENKTLYPGVFLGQGILFLQVISSFIRMFLSIDSLLINYSLLSSVFITLVVVYEAATLEVIVQTVRQNKPKTA